MPKKRHSASKYLPRGLDILDEDKDILVVDKPAGLLTVGTDNNKTRTAYYMLTDYVARAIQGRETGFSSFIGWTSQRQAC